ncbi:hypothetical protein H2200_001875 [Cladophialophora chaetospira]|uniref:Monooxygenase n=1 Tax=Cladophialophora chaetospira TaxID=386627 RepID=A0AA38XLU1_9EURO|nr:hypothetical protein H2200_001875 [Cladophialophora chaetospira]
MAAPRHNFCLIIGGGVSGLVQAAELLRHRTLKREGLHILERAEDYGGVWKAATYPGAACDVFSILYQVSWHRNPAWKNLFPNRDELVDYYRQFADYYHLRESTTFKQNVLEATWLPDEMLWRVECEDVETHEKTLWTANVLIQAVGTYNRKKIPKLPGIDSFEGDIWHTLDWPAKFDFTNKRVAYIGTGPTSLQALPLIQSQTDSVTIYMRSMTYCHPFRDFQYPAWLLWVFGRIPGVLSVYAALVSFFFGIWAWFVFRPNSFLAKQEEARCKKHLTKTVSDPDLRAKLKPIGRFGAKRPLVSDTFFKLVQQANVSVVSEDLVGVTTDGITSQSRQPLETPTDTAGVPQLRQTNRPFDVIIWGTGFLMQGWGSMVPTRGLNGTLLSDHWADEPETLYGTMTSNFPNLIILNGPNTVTPWGSLIRGVERQAMHARRLMKLIHARSASSPTGRYAIMPKPGFEDLWTESLQSELDTLATSTRFGPGFYYLSKSGRNTFFFPFTQSYYAWRTLWIKEEEYTAWHGSAKAEEGV